MNIARFCAVALCVLAFTPLVIPAKVPEPWLLDMPRTLWAGLAISLALVILTFITAALHGDQEDS